MDKQRGKQSEILKDALLLLEDGLKDMLTWKQLEDVLVTKFDDKKNVRTALSILRESGLIDVTEFLIGNWTKDDQDTYVRTKNPESVWKMENWGPRGPKIRPTWSYVANELAAEGTGGPPRPRKVVFLRYFEPLGNEGIMGDERRGEEVINEAWDDEFLQYVKGSLLKETNHQKYKMLQEKLHSLLADRLVTLLRNEKSVLV